MEVLLKKLDLGEYIDSYTDTLAREKSLILQGDIHLHYKLIKELYAHPSIKPLPSMINLDYALALLQKSGTLRLEEIFAFVKIIKYFLYLKEIFEEGVLLAWMQKIDIPQELLEICEYFDEKGNLLESVDEQFASIEIALKHIKDEMSSSLRRLMSSAKLSAYLVDRQVHYLNNQEALLVRGGFNHVLKGNIIGRSSGGFFYVAPESLAKLKARQSTLMDKKEALIYEYCKKISSVFNKMFLFLNYINKEFDRFDSYYARVWLAKSKDMEFVLPKKSHQIKLQNFSHPALKDAKPVSLDFSKQVLMITGVNAGGKTMLLKSILSAALMAKYLLPMHIDASKSVIGSFKNIDTILDDPQNVKNDISTFAGRMKQFSKLFSKKASLVGVDEIELGTDADEAASLFKVIIEKLIVKDMKIVITTHHKRLASLLATHEEVELLAAIYDEENQRPTYGFLQGTIGKSYAFETALRYGIPANLISEAKEVYGNDKEKLNELIQKNIDLELSMKNTSKKLSLELEEVERLKKQIKESKALNQDEFMELKVKMSKEYNKAINAAKEAIKSKDKQEAHRKLNEANEYRKATQNETVQMKPIPLKVGDRVKYGSSKGIIKSIKKDTAMIDCDGVRLRVPVNTLKRSGNAPTPTKKGKVTIHANKSSATSTVLLDLHGMRSDEAVEKLDKFLSDALINGYDEVKVYHGIGTGKLAFAVREFLKTHPSVRFFKDAPANQGGYGATLISL